MSFIKKLFRPHKSSPNNINSLISKLKKDSKQHEKVGEPLTHSQIEVLKKKSGFPVPPSFSILLQEFGDGAYWLYGRQPLDAFNNPFWLRDLRPGAPEIIQLDRKTLIPKDSLFCLMSEDSNGGSWCWLTSLQGQDNEYPLAYYQPYEKKLFYMVSSITEWLSILVENKNEVIRILDAKKDKLGLG